MVLCICIVWLKASDCNIDQIVEFWQSKREIAYFATAANFDPKISIIFDLRKQHIIDDFYEIRQLPIVARSISPIIANEGSDTDGYFDGNEIVMAYNKIPQPISIIQKVLNFVKSIFY